MISLAKRSERKLRKIKLFSVSKVKLSKIRLGEKWLNFRRGGKEGENGEGSHLAGLPKC